MIYNVRVLGCPPVRPSPRPLFLLSVRHRMVSDGMRIDNKRTAGTERGTTDRQQEQTRRGHDSTTDGRNDSRTAGQQDSTTKSTTATPQETRRGKADGTRDSRTESRTEGRKDGRTRRGARARAEIYPTAWSPIKTPAPPAVRQYLGRNPPAVRPSVCPSPVRPPV